MSNLRELPDGTVQKQCSKCREWKALPESFGLHKKGGDGFRSSCKACQPLGWDASRKRDPVAAKNYERARMEKKYRDGYINPMWKNFE